MSTEKILVPDSVHLSSSRPPSAEIGAEVTKENFPLFFDYLELMKQDPAVKKSYIPKEIHVAMVKTFVTGVHDYSVADLQGTGVTVYSRKED